MIFFQLFQTEAHDLEEFNFGSELGLFPYLDVA